MLPCAKTSVGVSGTCPRGKYCSRTFSNSTCRRFPRMFLDLLAAGVPCQPFSIGGKHRGHEDDRNMFSATVDVVRKLKPKAILIENVRGLKRPSFARYFGCC